MELKYKGATHQFKSLYDLKSFVSQEIKNDNRTGLDQELAEYFVDYPFVTSLPLGWIGTFFKYELSGERTSGSNENEEAKVDKHHPNYSKEAEEEAYSKSPYVDEDVIEEFYGDWPDRGGQMLWADFYLPEDCDLSPENVVIEYRFEYYDFE